MRGVGVAQQLRPLRADAQRNHDAIVAAASAEFARLGSEASLEEIARRAGVGSATLHRRFPTRRDLVQTVFAEQIQELCDRAERLSKEHQPLAALRAWLVEIAVYSAQTRGLADTIRFDDAEPPDGSCEAELAATAAALVQRAQDADTIRAAVSALQLLALVNGISIAAKDHFDPAASASSLTLLALDGIATR